MGALNNHSNMVRKIVAESVNSQIIAPWFFSGAKRNRATLLKESTIVEPQYRPQLSARRNSSITKKWKSKVYKMVHFRNRVNSSESLILLEKNAGSVAKSRDY